MTTALDRPADLPEEFRLMINTLTEIAGEEDSMSTSISIANGVLTQNTLEGILGASEAAIISGEDYVGIPFPLAHKNIQWRKSGDQFKDQGGFPFYAVVQTKTPKSEPIVLGIGGVSLTPTIFALWDGDHLQEFGDEGIMVEIFSVPTSAGWNVLKLRRAGGKK